MQLPLRARLPLAALITSLLSTASATAQCPGPDDGLEDNDTCQTAVPLATGSYLGLFVEKLDSDFYVVTAQPGQYFVAKLRFPHAGGDIDALLYDAGTGCTTSLVSSTSATDDEGLAWLNTGATAATYILEVQVWGGSAADCANYDLILSNEVDPCTLPDDGLEENDSCAAAVPVPIGASGPFWVDKFDLDYYSLTLQPGDTLVADFFFCDALADIDVILYDPAISCGGGSGSGLTESATATDNEQITWTNSTGAANSYIIEVYVWGPGVGDCNLYDMNVSGPTGLLGTSYCGPAVPNSTGLAALISAAGSPVPSTDDVTLTVDQVPPGQFGYFLAGQTQGFFNPPGSAGFICLMGNIGRYNQVSDIIQGPSGSIALDLGAIPVNPPTAVQPGDTWNFQCWYRDSGTSNFSDGLSVVFQ
ncbi:MAG: hypothetical protein GY711_32560 [bacterium]|nr:hypothetical protein [bacterium]